MKDIGKEALGLVLLVGGLWIYGTIQYHNSNAYKQAECSKIAYRLSGRIGILAPETADQLQQQLDSCRQQFPIN